MPPRDAARSGPAPKRAPRFKTRPCHAPGKTQVSDLAKSIKQDPARMAIISCFANQLRASAADPGGQAEALANEEPNPQEFVPMG